MAGSSSFALPVLAFVVLGAIVFGIYRLARRAFRRRDPVTVP